MKAANTMTHISMYIGETFRKQTNAIDKTTTAHDHHFIFVAFIMSMTGTPMSATTTGLMPLNALITYSLSLKLVKNIATNNMIRNGGRQLAIVATTLPFVPRSLCPVNMAMFTANNPGAVCDKVMISTKSSSLSHLRLTISDFIAAIIGMPPPIVNAPIFANIQNICHRLTIFAINN